MALARTTAAALVAALATASAAQAGTARVAESMLLYVAAPGEANDVLVTRSPDAFRIGDSGTPVTPGPGCTALSANQVACRARGVVRLEIQTNDLADVVSLSIARPSIVSGGAGDDILEGGLSRDVLRGDDGNDVLRGGVGEDELVGGPGADTMSGGNGFLMEEEFGEGEAGGGVGFVFGDVVFEAEVDDLGFDAVRYDGRTEPVNVDLDGVADDGAAGEGDNVLPDVEWVFGGRAGDLLVGTGGFNVLIGRGGGDTLVGGRGPDVLSGGPGNDTASGGPGGDLLTGEAGNDRLRAGAGRDVLVGGRGSDLLEGGAGPDMFSAADRTRDVVRGGPGDDQGEFDPRLDVVTSAREIGEAPPSFVITG